MVARLRHAEASTPAGVRGESREDIRRQASVVPPVGFTFQDLDKTLHPRSECSGRATQSAFAEQDSISARNYREGGTAAVHLRATRYGGHPSRVYDVSSLLGKTFACHR